MQETQVRSLGWEDTLEKGMAIHSSILAWRIPWMEGLGGLQSMGCKESDTTEQLFTSGIFIISITFHIHSFRFLKYVQLYNLLEPSNGPMG